MREKSELDQIMDKIFSHEHSNEALIMLSIESTRSSFRLDGKEESSDTANEDDGSTAVTETSIVEQ